MILHGDCLEQMKTLADNSVDAIITDPPYGLSFKGKKWDYDVPSEAIWREALRVLKPGGHVLSFCGTRTYHRMVVRIEDAGFEIRDQIVWLYGQGFPKSGTALKPANEPICLARKPLEKGLTIAENVLKWGCGALNVDASRIGVDENDPNKRQSTGGYKPQESEATVPNAPYNKQRDATLTQGRWPANILFDEEAARVLDEQSGISKEPLSVEQVDKSIWGTSSKTFKGVRGHGDSGGASRFFYVAKASRRERGDGNGHLTVKPIKLMEYLITLITPIDGTVLDPFMGSGSTGVAAKNLGRKFIGIERDADYFEIAKKRIGAA